MALFVKKLETIQDQNDQTEKSGPFEDATTLGLSPIPAWTRTTNKLIPPVD
jgi:hypothetical protein